MKKIISALLAITLVFAFSACSSNEYVDVPVTDENGQAVTDENGEQVTERVKADEASTEKSSGTSQTNNSGSSQSGSNSGSGSASAQNTGSNSSSGGSSGSNSNSNSNSSSNSGSNSSGNSQNNNSNSSGNNNSNSNSDKTDSEEDETVKNETRDIKVKVNLPYYNEQNTEITVYYKLKGDKKNTKLASEKVVLDGSKSNESRTYTIKKVKGEVTVTVLFDGIDITKNVKTVAADENQVTISPVTGIEIMNGGMD